MTIKTVDLDSPDVVESPTNKEKGDTIHSLKSLERQAITIKRNIESHIGQIKALIEKV